MDDAQTRKERPVYSGVLRYFPKALLEVAHTSWVGNEQHNPGEPLRWNRAKSTDEADALVRHLMQAGEIDTDGVRHTAKVAWRALALLEKELEAAELPAVDNTPAVRVYEGPYTTAEWPADPDPVPLTVKGSDEPAVYLPPNFGPGSEAANTGGPAGRVYIGEDGDEDRACIIGHV